MALAVSSGVLTLWAFATGAVLQGALVGVGILVAHARGAQRGEEAKHDPDHGDGRPDEGQGAQGRRRAVAQLDRQGDHELQNILQGKDQQREDEERRDNLPEATEEPEPHAIGPIAAVGFR